MAYDDKDDHVNSALEWANHSAAEKLTDLVDVMCDIDQNGNSYSNKSYNSIAYTNEKPKNTD